MNFDDVFEEELEQLGKRRAMRAGEATDDSPPASAQGLIGLCFSGGGIRSATFNLGLARGLHRWGLLDRVDYLSTVSGGGYVGSCLVDHVRRGRADELLMPRDRSVGEPRGITRLRGYGRFLTPTGSLGEWLQAMASIMRGVLWNAACFSVLAFALAALCSFALDGAGQWLFPFPHGIATWACVAAFALAMMLSVFSAELVSASLLVALVGLTLGVAAMDALPTVLEFAARHREPLRIGVISSGVTALLGSGVLSKLPAKLLTTAARLFAFVLALIVPLGLFVLLLLRFVAGSPTLAIEQAVALGLALVFLFVDFNRTSVHDFYRDRIGAAFTPDNPRLSEFVDEPGPLHLINVALNVPSEADPSLRDRRADFFTLSCLHVGGPRTGYAPTPALEQARRDFTLTSAVAISGAAASPNMGSFTDSLIRPIMTLLNIRLGYWVPHPAALLGGASGFMPRLNYLLREMTGDLTTETKLVNISDGGHLENLGAFELLRRRCKLIIIGDGGAGTNFDALALLIRFARTDLNADIEIDLDDLRNGADGLATKQAALGTVHYADGSVGRILYLKSCLTGREPPDVRYYKDTHPAFPGESTADQWFDDAQFDAYLSLGEEVVDSLFHQLGYTDPAALIDDGCSWDQRLAALDVVLAPSARSRARELMEHLNRVEEALLGDALDDYRSQMAPTQFARPIPTERLHELVPIVMLQLQLMENAVEQLGLIDARNRGALANRGWMNLFRLWSRSDAFQRVALVCLPSFGAQLTHFMDVGLQLGTQFEWAEHPDAARFPNLLLLGETNPELAGDQPRRRLITGVAAFTRTNAGIVVRRLALRTGFEGHDRLESAVAALRHRFGDAGVEFVEQAAAVTKHLSGDAYVHAPVPREWRAADEAAILALSRETHERDERGEPDDESDNAWQAMAFEPPRA